MSITHNCGQPHRILTDMVDPVRGRINATPTATEAGWIVRAEIAARQVDDQREPFLVIHLQKTATESRTIDARIATVIGPPSVAWTG